MTARVWHEIHGADVVVAMERGGAIHRGTVARAQAERFARSILLDLGCDGAEPDQEPGDQYITPPEWRLTRTERGVLKSLMSGGLVTRERIFQSTWGHKQDPVGEKIVDVYVFKLRGKLARLGVEIETVWNQGYRISAEGKAILQPEIDQAHAEFKG